jgi:RHS repeat-associated protein
MEQFWEPFRKSGKTPSNQAYLEALRDALGAVKDATTGAPKYIKQDIDTLVQFAEKEQRGYGPFGEVIRATGPMAKANPFRFSTKYQDDESDLLYYGYRYYNASTGRWLSRDPLEEQGGPNLFEFVNNSPQLYVDILGMDPMGDDFGSDFPDWSDCQTIVQWKKSITRNVAAVIYGGVSWDITVKKCKCCYRFSGKIEGEGGVGWSYKNGGGFTLAGFGYTYNYGFELSAAKYKIGAETAWTWCPGVSFGHDESLFKLVDFTLGPTASVGGSVSLTGRQWVSASADISGTAYANGRVIGGLRFKSEFNHASLEAVGALAFNAGFTAKGTIQAHIFNSVNILPWTFLDIDKKVGSDDVLNPPLETIGKIWSN